MESHYGCLISSVLSFLKHDFPCDFHDGLFAEIRYLLIMHSLSRNHALVNWIFHDHLRGKANILLIHVMHYNIS